MVHHKYVHGYSARESDRLTDQAQTLTDLLHHDTRYSAGAHVLKAGCGIGAQTVILAKNSPGHTSPQLIYPETLWNWHRKLSGKQGLPT